jgi:hypothetical protein
MSLWRVCFRIRRHGRDLRGIQLNDFVAAQKEQTLPDLIALFSAED